MEFIVAIVTPFMANNSIDTYALVRMLEFLRSGGVTTILLKGMTGEYINLERTERRYLISFVRQYWSGRLLVNISDDDPYQVIRYGMDARLCGADGVVLLPPRHRAVEDYAVEDFFTTVLAAIDLPVYFYNLPKLIETVLQPEMVRRLKDRFPQIVGVKDSSGSVASLRGFRKICPELKLYVGSDLLAPFASMHGCAGWVSGACGAIPAVALQLLEAQRRRDEEELQRLFRVVRYWNALLHGDNGSVIAGTKLALAHLIQGFNPHCREPHGPRLDGDRIKEFLDDRAAA